MLITSFTDTEQFVHFKWRSLRIQGYSKIRIICFKLSQLESRITDYFTHA